MEDRPVPTACIPRPAVPYAPVLFVAYPECPPTSAKGEFLAGGRDQR